MSASVAIGRRFAGNWTGLLGGSLVLAVAVVALLAPLVAPHDPFGINLLSRLKPPAWVEGGSWTFPLGTDNVGRDVLSRIIWGSRVSLAVGLGAVVVGAFVGTTVGLLSGYFGGWVDAVLSWLIEVQLSFPFTLLAIFLLATFGAGSCRSCSCWRLPPGSTTAASCAAR